MSLLLAGLVFAGTSGGLALGRWLLGRRARSEAAPTKDGGNEGKDAASSEDEHERRAKAEVEADVPTAKDSAPDAAAKDAPKDAAVDDRKKPTPRRAATSETVVLEGFVCQLGDVVTRITGEEAWLAGGLVLAEEVPLAVLYVAPDAGHDRALYVCPRPRSALFWLEPLDPSAILVGGDPPSAVEYDGVRYDRIRRLPLRTRRLGVGAPDFGDALVVAEYASGGAERLLVLKGNSGTVLAYRGLELEEGSFEVIASGAQTLE